LFRQRHWEAANEAIFIAVDTPPGETGAAHLSYVEVVASEIARSIGGYKVIAHKNTVPVYTNECIRKASMRFPIPNSCAKDWRLSTSCTWFLHLDRIVVGAVNSSSVDGLRHFERLAGGRYYRQPGVYRQSSPGQSFASALTPHAIKERPFTGR
jgi:UDPglucose 6-dehydrogenase